MDIDQWTKAASFANRAIGAVALLGALGLATANYDAVSASFRTGLRRIGEIQEVKTSVLSLSFNSAELDRNADLFRIDKFASEKIARQFERIGPRGVTRVMQVGLLKNLCAFSTPTVEMEEQFALDHLLEDEKLVKRVFSDALATQVRNGLTSDANGQPLRCYEMTLTDDGFDVRTVITQLLGARLAGAPAAATAPAASEKSAQAAPAARTAQVQETTPRTPAAHRTRLATARN